MIELHDLFEWHDWFVYLTSLCMLCSLACSYLTRMPAAFGERWPEDAALAYAAPRDRQSASMAPTQGQRLVRLTKRKEAPDDDSSPCMDLLNP